jgi:hypothetical protein
MQNIKHKYQYYPVRVDAVNSIFTASIPALMMAGGGENMFTLPQYVALLNLCTSTKALVQYFFFNKSV